MIISLEIKVTSATPIYAKRVKLFNMCLNTALGGYLGPAKNLIQICIGWNIGLYRLGFQLKLYVFIQCDAISWEQF